MLFAVIASSRIEDAILQRIREYILTAENLKQLMVMVNEELHQAQKARESAQVSIGNQIAEKRKRLDRLWESLETGHLEFSDVAPRIKNLKDQLEALEHQRTIGATEPQELHVSERAIGDAVAKLRETLETGSVSQRKAFLRSFVRKIEYGHPRITIFYTFPILPGNPSNGGGNTEELLYDEEAVLGIGKKGSSGRTRTYNPPVN